MNETLEVDPYIEFLKSKEKAHVVSGFDVAIDTLNPKLFLFQKFCVHRALKYGKFAIFSGTGTGKSLMEASASFEVVKHTGKSVLILAPLAVSSQTVAIAKGMNIEICRIDKNTDFSITGIFITNYEQLDNLPIEFINDLGGVILDEGSILKNPDGVYRNKLIHTFKLTPYKFVFTATPSPNSPMENGSYSEFLDVMPYNEVLAMYFVHDAGKTQEWRIKKHAIKVYWRFITSFSIMFTVPQDIGFNNEGFDLPPLNLIEKKIITAKRDNGQLFNDMAVSATTFGRELRFTKIERLDQVAEIVNNSKEIFCIWIKHNDEEDYLKKLIPDAIIVTGSDSTEYKEEKLLDFAEGRIRVLISKTKICGSGMNFQVCHNTIYASPDFSFEAVYQSLRRFLRFGQFEIVNAWIITTDTMENVLQTFKKKEHQFDEMQKEMIEASKESLYVDAKGRLKRKFKEYKTKNFMYQLGDAVQLIRNIENESIGFSIWSPPFPTLYVYSNEIEDMGNCKDFNQFFRGFNFLTPELYRVMMQGRNVAIHCMDIPIQKGKEGFIGLRDFSGMIIESMVKAGFIYHSRVTLWKNPVTEMQRSKALGLLHKQIKKDSIMSRVGIPDYLLVFRKEGDNEVPIRHQDKDKSLSNYLPVDTWQKYASPVWDDNRLHEYDKNELVETIEYLRSEIMKLQGGSNNVNDRSWLDQVWMDIDQGDTLNSKNAKDHNDERHIAPLQLGTIRRALHLWSNEGETILTTYGGIGSEGVEAIKLKRKAILFELKESYFNEGVQNCLMAEKLQSQKNLFDDLTN